MTDFERDEETLENAFPLIIMEVLKGRLNTVVPARVEAFDGKNRVTVQPVIMRKYKDKAPQALDPVEDIPVLFMGAGGYWFTFPIAVGSWVVLLCSQRSLAAWKNSSDGGVTEPSTNRRFSVSDAIAIPGLLPFSKSFDVGSYIQMVGETGFVRIDGSGQVNINNHFTVDP